MNGTIINRVLLDQFRVDDFIAAGGMGAVYRVWDLKRNAHLAMKVLHADLADDPAILKRFQREARALQKLAHPNIVPFYGLHHTDDFTFLLQFFVDGPSLKELLRQRKGRPFSIPETLIFLKALSAALGYAHAHGVVHCDVKPGNVMLDQGGSIYLTDFGIARHAESTTTTLGQAGSPAYMTPEQIRGEPVTPATDVYALGVLLFEMLSGQKPFTGEEDDSESGGTTRGERTRYAHLKLSPPDPTSLNAALSADLAAILLRALAKNPLDRYQNTQELYKATRMALGVVSGDVAFKIDPPEPSTQPKPTDHSPSTEQSTIIQKILPFIKRRGTLGGLAAVLGATVLVVILAASGTTGLLAGSGNRTTPSPEVNILLGAVVETPEVTILPPTSTPASLPPTQSPAASPTRTAQPAQQFLPGAIQTNPKDSAEIVFVPEGQFTMGITPQQLAYLLSICADCTRGQFEPSMPAHLVYLDSFWIYKHEVTNKQYQRCVAAGSCPPPSSMASEIHADYYTNPFFISHPVVNVDWNSANQYCQWADGRLPTEAEWEKAARGTDQRLFPWGDQVPDLSFANTANILGDTEHVGIFPGGASPYGVMDMAGNVWEWVADWYEADYYARSPEENPQGPPSSAQGRRVGRGGSWYWGGAYASAAYHDWWEPEKSDNGVGFRCVVDRVP